MIDNFLQETKIIDFSHPTIQKLSQKLAKDCKSD
jgi:hypothetical protein